MIKSIGSTKNFRKAAYAIALVLIFVLTIFTNNSTLISQNLASYNHISLTKYSVNVPKEFKLYDISTNWDYTKSLKFDIPNQTTASIIITNEDGNIVKDFLYENIYSGSYEINLGVGNYSSGNYKVILQAGDNSQTITFTLI